MINAFDPSRDADAYYKLLQQLIKALKYMKENMQKEFQNGIKGEKEKSDEALKKDEEVPESDGNSDIESTEDIQDEDMNLDDGSLILGTDEPALEEDKFNDNSISPQSWFEDLPPDITITSGDKVLFQTGADGEIVVPQGQELENFVQFMQQEDEKAVAKEDFEVPSLEDNVKDVAAVPSYDFDSEKFQLDDGELPELYETETSFDADLNEFTVSSVEVSASTEISSEAIASSDESSTDNSAPTTTPLLEFYRNTLFEKLNIPTSVQADITQNLSVDTVDSSQSQSEAIAPNSQSDAQPTQKTGLDAVKECLDSLPSDKLQNTFKPEIVAMLEAYKQQKTNSKIEDIVFQRLQEPTNTSWFQQQWETVSKQLVEVVKNPFEAIGQGVDKLLNWRNERDAASTLTKFAQSVDLAPGRNYETADYTLSRSRDGKTYQLSDPDGNSVISFQKTRLGFIKIDHERTALDAAHLHDINRLKTSLEENKAPTEAFSNRDAYKSDVSRRVTRLLQSARQYAATQPGGQASLSDGDYVLKASANGDVIIGKHNPKTQKIEALAQAKGGQILQNIDRSTIESLETRFSYISERAKRLERQPTSHAKVVPISSSPSAKKQLEM